MTHDGEGAIHEVIFVDGKPHEVEVRPLTLLFHRGECRIDVPGRFEISPETTVKHADAMEPEHWFLSRRHGLDGLFPFVFDDVALPDDPADLARLSLGVRHAVGLIDLLLIAVGTGAKPFLRLPETYLHPRSQTGIAEVLMRLSGYGSVRIDGRDVPSGELLAGLPAYAAGLSKIRTCPGRK